MTLWTKTGKSFIRILKYLKIALYILKHTLQGRMSYGFLKNDEKT